MPRQDGSGIDFGYEPIVSNSQDGGDVVDRDADRGRLQPLRRRLLRGAVRHGGQGPRRVRRLARTGLDVARALQGRRRELPGHDEPRPVRLHVACAADAVRRRRGRHGRRHLAHRAGPRQPGHGPDRGVLERPRRDVHAAHGRRPRGQGHPPGRGRVGPGPAGRGLRLALVHDVVERRRHARALRAAERVRAGRRGARGGAGAGGEGRRAPGRRPPDDDPGEAPLRRSGPRAGAARDRASPTTTRTVAWRRRSSATSCCGPASTRSSCWPTIRSRSAPAASPRRCASSRASRDHDPSNDAGEGSRAVVADAAADGPVRPGRGHQRGAAGVQRRARGRRRRRGAHQRELAGRPVPDARTDLVHGDEPRAGPRRRRPDGRARPARPPGPPEVQRAAGRQDRRRHARGLVLAAGCGRAAAGRRCRAVRRRARRGARRAPEHRRLGRRARARAPARLGRGRRAPPHRGARARLLDRRAARHRRHDARLHALQHRRRVGARHRPAAGCRRRRGTS